MVCYMIYQYFTFDVFTRQFQKNKKKLLLFMAKVTVCVKKDLA